MSQSTDHLEVEDVYEFSQRQVSDDDFHILPRLLPRGGRLLLGGDTGVGKSFLSLNIQKALVTATPLFGQPEWKTRTARTLYIEAEIGLTLSERIKLVFGAHIEALRRSGSKVASQPPGFNLSSPHCVHKLLKAVQEHGIEVLILDPFKALHYGDENSNTEISRIMQSLLAIQKLGCSIVILHHYSHPPRGQFAQQYDPLDLHNFRGASALIGDVDTILTLDRVPGKIIPSRTDNWKMKARWAKIRHGRFGACAEDFMLYFNEHGDGGMEWRPAEDEGGPKRRKVGL